MKIFQVLQSFPLVNHLMGAFIQIPACVSLVVPSCVF